jgi:soluble lytic murein transglycosylase-like protein
MLLLLATAHGWAALWARLAHLSSLEPIQATSLPSPQAPHPISSVFAPPVQFWAPNIQRWARQYALPPDLVATVMQIESCGDPHALSKSGAQGLFQVMPLHFASGEDPTEPETNARRGLRYLAGSLSLAGGDVARALAGYNGGHALVGLDPGHWPAETRRYVAWGTAILAEAQSRAPRSHTLDQWLAAGGQSLCRSAALDLGLSY